MSFNFHYDRKKYFDQQYQNTKKYIVPFLINTIDFADKNVLEVGCGEGGVLKAFYELGCNITGIDLASNKIENANKYYLKINAKNTYKFIADDIYNFDLNLLNTFDLIILKDAIEHIHHQNKLIQFLSENLKKNCKFKTTVYILICALVILWYKYLLDFEILGGVYWQKTASTHTLKNTPLVRVPFHLTN